MEHERQSRHPSQAVEPVLALTDRAVEMLQQALAQADVHASGIRLTAFLDPSLLQTTTL
jgi:hypothetical protein